MERFLIGIPTVWRKPAPAKRVRPGEQYEGYFYLERTIRSLLEWGIEYTADVEIWLFLSDPGAEFEPPRRYPFVNGRVPVHVVGTEEQQNLMTNSLRMMRHLHLLQDGVLFAMQDDVICCRRAIDRVRALRPPPNVGLVSFYTPWPGQGRGLAPYRGRDVYGTLANLWRGGAAAEFLGAPMVAATRRHKGYDLIIKRWLMWSKRWKAQRHVPCLFQHIGRVSSVAHTGGKRGTDNFKGQEYDAMTNETNERPVSEAPDEQVPSVGDDVGGTAKADLVVNKGTLVWGPFAIVDRGEHRVDPETMEPTDDDAGVLVHKKELVKTEDLQKGDRFRFVDAQPGDKPDLAGDPTHVCVGEPAAVPGDWCLPIEESFLDGDAQADAEATGDSTATNIEFGSTICFGPYLGEFGHEVRAWSPVAVSEALAALAAGKEVLISTFIGHAPLYQAAVDAGAKFYPVEHGILASHGVDSEWMGLKGDRAEECREAAKAAVMSAADVDEIEWREPGDGAGSCDGIAKSAGNLVIAPLLEPLALPDDEAAEINIGVFARDRRFGRMKNWDPRRWGAFASALAARMPNARLHSLGLTDENQLVDGTNDMRVDRGTGSLAGVLESMMGCHVILGGSSGPMHLALRAGRPTLVWGEGRLRGRYRADNRSSVPLRFLTRPAPWNPEPPVVARELVRMVAAMRGNERWRGALEPNVANA